MTIQAALADHHGERRAVALAEANVAASLAYLALIGVPSLTAALDAGWRVALLASLAVPALAWWTNRRLAIDAPPPSQVAQGRLPGVFWIAAAMLFCTTAAEWCITAWGAMGISVAVALAPGRAALASGRAVVMTSFAVLLAPLTVGTLADATSLTTALGIVPVILALATAGLAVVRHARTRATGAPNPQLRRPVLGDVRDRRTTGRYGRPPLATRAGATGR